MVNLEKRIEFGYGREQKLLHIEVPGAVVNIHTNLQDSEGRNVTRVEIQADQQLGEEWGIEWSGDDVAKSISFRIIEGLKLERDAGVVFGEYIIVRCTKEGNLQLSLTDEGKRAWKEGEFKRLGWDERWAELWEEIIANSDYEHILPEQVGALTSSPLIGRGLEWDEHGDELVDVEKVWWYPNYQVRCPMEEMYESGTVEFEASPDSEKVS